MTLTLNTLFLIGLLIVIGFLGGRASNRLKFPGVVGYLLAGLIIGPSFLNILNPEMLDNLGIFNDITLAIVAFMIGSQMRINTLKEMGKGLITIIFSESFGAFLLVFMGVFLLTHKLYIALIFGAMAPASAPAGTAVVLQEYRAKGPLTNALYAVVGLDDGLAIIIYAFAIALAKISISGASYSFAQILVRPALEIVGAIVLGGLLGIGFGFFMRIIRNRKEVLALSLAAVIICAGLASMLHVSLILANLTLGVVFVNLFLMANTQSTESLDFISLPVYIIFFVIAGAHLQISMLPAMGILGIVYIICRSTGLMGGAYIGATISKSAAVIRNYLGLGILSQAGVAIGLAIMVTKDFSPHGELGADIGLLVVNTIAATTIIFEIIGPITTKIAIQKANEIGNREVPHDSE
jgi:Kef-type K+ transport system membrane component KefB